MLIEKNPELGGSTAWSIGSVTASDTPHQVRKGIVDSPEDHWRDMAGFNGELDPRDNAALRRVLADAMPDTFRWLLRHGMRFYGPMPEPPHSKPRMHNVLPNSRSFIAHLVGRRGAPASTSVCDTRAVALVREEGASSRVDCTALRRRALPRARRRRAGGRRLHQRSRAEGTLHGAAGGQDRRRQYHRDWRRAEARLKLGARIINGDLALGPELRFVPPQRRNMLLDAAAVARCWPI